MLKLLISKMDVPEARKDLTRFANIIWLSKNLQTRNRNNPGFKTAIKIINKIITSNQT